MICYQPRNPWQHHLFEENIAPKSRTTSTRLISNAHDVLSVMHVETQVLLASALKSFSICNLDEPSEQNDRAGELACENSRYRREEAGRKDAVLQELNLSRH